MFTLIRFERPNALSSESRNARIFLVSSDNELVAWFHDTKAERSRNGLAESGQVNQEPKTVAATSTAVLMLQPRTMLEIITSTHSVEELLLCSP